MTRSQLADTVEIATGPLPVLRQDTPKGATQQVERQTQRELDSTASALARRRSRTECSHHWIIEVAISPLSKGVCKACGEERLFRNQLSWEEIMPVRAMNGHRPANGRARKEDQSEDYSPIPMRSGYGARFVPKLPVRVY